MENRPESRADNDADGKVDGLDVDGFVDAVISGGPAAQGVPEPSTLLLACLGLVALAWRRRLGSA